MKSVHFTAIALTLLVLPGVAFAGPIAHPEDFVVGRTNGGQLAVHFDFGELIQLPEISGGFLSGWGVADPGFFNNPADDAANDFYTLDPGADIRFEVVSFDAAFKGWTQGFASIFHDSGEYFPLGSPDFDEHPFWQIDSADPGFNPNQTQWHATGRLIDVGSTGYAPSDPFTVTFIPVPEPATLAILGLAGSAFLLRRRRSALSDNRF